MKIPRLALLFLCAGGGLQRAQADTISVNFINTDADSMLATDEAGPDDGVNVARAANWNNIQAAATGSATGLVRQDGAATTAGLEWTTDLGGWELPEPLPEEGVTGDDKMWKGYLDVSGSSVDNPGATVTVSGIPFTGNYDIYIYFDGDNGGDWRLANYQITSTLPAVQAFGEDSEGANWGLDENAAKVYQIPVAGANGNGVWPITPNNSEGNMLRFAGRRGASFTIKAWGSSNGNRAPINGFQIVESSDTDGDGLSDEWETSYGLDPQSAEGDNGGAGDPDGDGLTNLAELNLGSSPILADTDGDGLSDKVETKTGVWTGPADTGTDPTMVDTDGDGLTDNVENPTQANTGINQPGTDPNKKDGDGDGFDDATEVAFGSDPKLNTSMPALLTGKMNLLAYWPFDSATGIQTADAARGLPARLLLNAALTPAGGGHTGAAGDRAVDLGAAKTNSTVEVLPAGFLNLAAAKDSIAISFWQKLHTVSDSRAFYAGFIPEVAGADTRGLSSHATWSDNNFYWDTAGCCDGATQRISGANPGIDLLKWRHIVFQKNGPVKEIWVDGRLIASGESTAPLPLSFSRMYLGSSNGGAEQTQGLIDDFAIFGEALTENQIRRLFTGANPVALASETDSDGDGMPDSYEDANGLNKAVAADAGQDADGDGLTNFAEFQQATNPQKADTDGDGLSDKVETGTGVWVGVNDTGTNPLNADTDGDGLADGVETNNGVFGGASNAGTDPFSTDTDGDIYSDYEEVVLGSNPLDISGVPPLPMAIGYWPFDDQGPATTADISPGKHNGAVNGAPEFIAGHSGAAGDFAIHFDGTDDSVTTGAPLLASLTSFSMSGWVKMEAQQTGDRKGLFGQNDVVEFGIINPTTMEYWTPNGGAISATIADGVLPEWTHVAVVASGGTRSIYLNGVEASTGTIGAPAASASGFNIGGGGVQDATGNFFLGDIDDVAVWNKALTVDQVMALADKTLSPKDAVPAAVAPVAGFLITGITRDPATGNITLTWASQAGQNYQVKYTADPSAAFAGNAGAAVPGNAAGTSTVTFPNPVPGAAKLFFRVEQQ